MKIIAHGEIGKLMDRLQKQLENPDTKKYAEDCIKIFNWLKDTDPEGRVQSSQFSPLVNVVRLEGNYPNSIPIYKPTIIGYTLLKGIKTYLEEKDKKEQDKLNQFKK